MLFIRQFGIILIVSFIGEALKALIPLPIPASFYGLIIMLIALKTGIVKLNHVRHAAGVLIDIMPLMFIPAGVGLLNSWPEFRPVAAQFMIVTVISTVLVMVISGRTTQMILRREKKK